MFNTTAFRKHAARVKVTLAAVAFLSLAACDGTEITGASSNSASTTPTANLVETATEAGSFTTLITALQLTGLDEVLADDASMYTVFAPTDEAFAALGSDTINGLLAC